MTGQKLHETRNQVYDKSLNKRFNPNYDLKGFVARPGKSVSTTGRVLCQDFFMVNLVFFNASWPTRRLQTRIPRSNRGAAIREFVELRHSSRNLRNVTKTDPGASSNERSFIRIFGNPFKISEFYRCNLGLKPSGRDDGCKLTSEDETEGSQQTRVIPKRRGEYRR